MLGCRRETPAGECRRRAGSAPARSQAATRRAVADRHAQPGAKAGEAVPRFRMWARDRPGTPITSGSRFQQAGRCRHHSRRRWWPPALPLQQAADQRHCLRCLKLWIACCRARRWQFIRRLAACLPAGTTIPGTQMGTSAEQRRQSLISSQAQPCRPGQRATSTGNWLRVAAGWRRGARQRWQVGVDLACWRL